MADNLRSDSRMKTTGTAYVAIDLKSFYASVECVERELDPLNTNLVVADAARTEKTICLAVSPSLKSYGVSGRARLFEVVARMREVNAERRQRSGCFFPKEKSVHADVLATHPQCDADFLIAKPRMALYIDYSTRIYDIYLKYIAPEDIHVYSIDEVFIDVTNYLSTYRMSAHELAMVMVRDVLRNTGITATAGIGSNMYLSKVAMDIVAKRIPADKDGVRIAELDEMSYRKMLWNHRPLTSFWRIGKGIAQKLEAHGIYTMGQIARCSLENERLLYRLFGVNAELIIDHAWGWEPCTIAQVKAYRPEHRSLHSSQVLNSPYDAKKARVVAWEMADAVALELVATRMVSNQLTLTIGYDREGLNPDVSGVDYEGATTIDRYGREVPKHAHTTINLDGYTSSAHTIVKAVLSAYDSIVHPQLLVRRLTIATHHIVDERKCGERTNAPVQLDLFVDYEAQRKEKEEKKAAMDKERKMQEAILEIKNKFGKNAILKGVSFDEGATARERNQQIGGHKA